MQQFILLAESPVAGPGAGEIMVITLKYKYQTFKLILIGWFQVQVCLLNPDTEKTFKTNNGSDDKTTHESKRAKAVLSRGNHIKLTHIKG